MGSVTEELWLFLPSKIKDKILILISTSILLFFLFFLIGYYMGTKYGIIITTESYAELLKNCLFIK